MCTDVFIFMMMKMGLERVISENVIYKSTEWLLFFVGELSNKDAELFKFLFFVYE